MYDPGARLAGLNDTLLRWHGQASELAFEAVRPWLLATLHGVLRFDGAVWAPSADAAGIADATVQGLDRDLLAAWQHTPPAALLRAADAVAALRPADDPAQDDDDHALLRGQCRRHGIAHLLAARPAGQLVVLTRSAEGDAWSLADIDAFALLAPHLALAEANQRRLLLLDTSRGGGRRNGPAGVAAVDAGGVLQDHDARFLALLRREWADWPGQQLPPALLPLLARRHESRWRFLGQQVAADFTLLRDGLYLMTVRARHPADVLTPRESDVARRYAGGESFRAIADAMQLSPATVRAHIRNGFAKLGVRSKLQLAAALQ